MAGVGGSRTHPGRRRPPRNDFEDRETHRDPSTPTYRNVGGVQPPIRFSIEAQIGAVKDAVPGVNAAEAKLLGPSVGTI